MPTITYINDKMSVRGFWEELPNIRSITTPDLKLLLNHLKQFGKYDCGVFSNIVMMMEGVAAGQVNPVALLVNVMGDSYVIAPNGDLLRIYPKGDDCDHISLKKVKVLLGSGTTTVYPTSYNTSFTNSSTSTSFSWNKKED